MSKSLYANTLSCSQPRGNTLSCRHTPPPLTEHLTSARQRRQASEIRSQMNSIDENQHAFVLIPRASKCLSVVLLI